ncbi:RnfABCDGE type electron transport complex subunit G [Wenzhouxiangella marina]|uniref:Ion-translocating oxidoreductase complex subunit G n=1 Tax=Wenzhouxiangella marina TaxID=1579979 RepID=A0A0K0XVK0_9GAMM|nr:RnfABCDGE type electron transport complex subunit G [Wenzhouxiangella marina]AKS41662.1 Electron transport complex subunit G [Wenzhouxiangella marina]MBB6086577.1 electron transport complex protein RnfG [Wenzhouxiangella marina]
MSEPAFPWRPALALALLAIAAAVLLAGLNRVTEAPIREAREQRALRVLNQVLAPSRYDNDLARDRVDIAVGALDPSARVHRAYLQGEPSAAVIDMSTPRGYSGDIRLLIAITPEAEVISVRVVEHRETPGLGDRVEARRSDWIDQFAGRSIDQPPREAWASDQRGGAFDTLTSATITSTAVIDAVATSLEAYRHARERIWAAEGEAPSANR